MIPLMTSKRLMMGLTQHQAHATSLFAVGTTGLAGAVSYSTEVDVEVAAAIALCGMVTAGLGANASARLSQEALRKALGAFMLVVAPTIPAKDYLFEATSRNDDEMQKKNEHEDPGDKNGIYSSSSFAWRILTACGIGCCSGFLAGMFGVGGGAVVVPALSVFMDMNHYQALGTSLCGTCAVSSHRYERQTKDSLCSQFQSSS